MTSSALEFLGKRTDLPYCFIVRRFVLNGHPYLLVTADFPDQTRRQDLTKLGKLAKKVEDRFSEDHEDSMVLVTLKGCVPEEAYSIIARAFPHALVVAFKTEAETDYRTFSESLGYAVVPCPGETFPTPAP